MSISQVDKGRFELKMYKCFKDMYSNVKLTVTTVIEKRIFSSNVGLLQGQITFPILFILFVNYLEMHY